MQGIALILMSILLLLGFDPIGMEYVFDLSLRRISSFFSVSQVLFWLSGKRSKIKLRENLDSTEREESTKWYTTTER